MEVLCRCLKDLDQEKGCYLLATDRYTRVLRRTPQYSLRGIVWSEKIYYYLEQTFRRDFAEVFEASYGQDVASIRGPKLLLYSIQAVVDCA